LSKQISAEGGTLTEKFADIAGVQKIHQVAGKDGYLVKLRVTDTETLRRILRDDIAILEETCNTHTQIIISTFKETWRLNLSASDEHVV
jgi:Lrp/AsnC family transcriptional regulator, leucine-responsive regulatory protein